MRIAEDRVSDDADRYHRLRLLGWRSEILRQARILVAGAGALGNEVIKNLAMLGVGEILIADFDRIETSNLSRAVLFRLSDAERRLPKAQVAAVRARELNPDVRACWANLDVSSDLGTGVYRRVDLVLGCLDNRAARLALNQACRLTGRAWMEGALHGTDGHVRLFEGSAGPCYECTFSEQDYWDIYRRYSCQGLLGTSADEGVTPTAPTAAAIVGGILVENAVRWLHGEEVPLGCTLLYTSRSHELLKIRLKERDDCLAHESATPLVELDVQTTPQLTLGRLLQSAKDRLGPESTLSLDREILTAAACPRCTTRERRIAAARKVPASSLVCVRCNVEMTPTTQHRVVDGTGLVEVAVTEAGFPPGHIYRAQSPRGDCYLEATGDFAGGRTPGFTAVQEGDVF